MDTKTWQQQKEDKALRQSMPSLASDAEIANNLKRFASQRPDLYYENDGKGASAEQAK